MDEPWKEPSPELIEALKAFGMDMPPAGLPMATLDRWGRSVLHSESKGMVLEGIIERTAHAVLFEDGKPAVKTCHKCGNKTKGYVRKPGSQFYWCFNCW